MTQIEAEQIETIKDGYQIDALDDANKGEVVIALLELLDVPTDRTAYEGSDRIPKGALNAALLATAAKVETDMKASDRMAMMNDAARLSPGDTRGKTVSTEDVELPEN